MRVIKLMLISAVILFGLMTLISLMIPSHVRISRAIDINAAKPQLMPLIQQRDEWPRWNAYAKEPGRFDISIVESNDSLVVSRWKAGGKDFTSGMAVYEPRQGTLTVQWYFDFRLKWYPLEKFGSIMFDRQLGSPMEESLVNLKQLAEADR